jgi:cytochrome c-type biogenesis protein CcmH
MKRLLPLLALLFLSTAAFAVTPDEMLKDPALEARAREVSRQLRCLVCQGEDIDESRAPLAADLRRIVRERIVAGDTNEETISYIRARYGDYVLMKPPLKGETLLLWAAPFLALAGGGWLALRLSRKREA